MSEPRIETRTDHLGICVRVVGDRGTTQWWRSLTAAWKEYFLMQES